MPGHLIDGRQISSDWQAEIAAEVAHIRKFGGRAPGLAVVLVGHRPDSVLYVERKREAAAEVGFDFRLEHLPHSATQAEIVAAVRSLCLDPAVDGVLVQLPLPPHIDEESVMEAFDPRKDVDGFHPINIGRIVMRGRCATSFPRRSLSRSWPKCHVPRLCVCTAPDAPHGLFSGPEPPKQVLKALPTHTLL